MDGVNDWLVPLLAALLGFIPALPSLINGRRRSLQAIQQEIAVFDALPKRMRGARVAIRRDIAKSVERYTGRFERRFNFFKGYGFTVGWVALIVGYNLYKGDVPEDTLKSLRIAAASVLVIIGVAIMIVCAFAAVINYKDVLTVFGLQIKGVVLNKKIKRRDKTIDSLEREAYAMQRESRQFFEEAHLIKNAYTRAGQIVPPEVHAYIAIVAPRVAQRRWDKFEPSTETAEVASLREAIRNKRRMFKRRVPVNPQHCGPVHEDPRSLSAAVMCCSLIATTRRCSTRRKRRSSGAYRGRRSCPEGSGLPVWNGYCQTAKL